VGSGDDRRIRLGSPARDRWLESTYLYRRLIDGQGTMAVYQSLGPYRPVCSYATAYTAAQYYTETDQHQGRLQPGGWLNLYIKTLSFKIPIMSLSPIIIPRACARGEQLVLSICLSVVCQHKNRQIWTSRPLRD
jgi:hypothetical protein